MAVCLWLVYLSDHMSDRPKISDMACAWADGVHPQLKKKKIKTFYEMILHASPKRCQINTEVMLLRNDCVQVLCYTVNT